MLVHTTAILSKVCRTYTQQTDGLDLCANAFIDLDVDLPFSQPVTFAHLEWQRCLAASHDKVRRSFTRKTHPSAWFLIWSKALGHCHIRISV